MPPTTAFSPGSVVVVRFPFAGGAATKARPAVVVSSDTFHSGRGDLLILAVTSRLANRLAFEPLLDDWQVAGLFKPSVLKAAIATVRSADVAASIGRLSVRDEQKLKKLLADMLAYMY